MSLDVLLILAGVFSLALGGVHFIFPLLLDFRAAIPVVGEPLRPLRLGPLRYDTRRSDVYGIAWIMNWATSFVLVSVGLVDLAGRDWLYSAAAGPWLGGWIATWWFIRAGAQLHIGRGPVSLAMLALFASLGVLHAAVALGAAGG